jgi:uncharacterized protein
VTLKISLTAARRLAIMRQRLAGDPPEPSPDRILSVVRDLGCLQIDPINVVARSHQLVIFSRVGPYDMAHLDDLLWRDRKLFEYWAHCASIVLTEDFPIYHARMRNYLKGDTDWDKRTRKWIGDNAALRRTILSKLRKKGALPARAFEEDGIGTRDWVSTGWTSGRNVSRMLDFLWLSGAIMVAGRDGLQKIWDLADRVLPDWTPRDRWREREIVRHAAQRSLRALGVATPRQIGFHFIRGRYTDLPGVLRDLQAEGKIQRIEIGDKGKAIPGDWFIHTDDLPNLDALANGAWAPRTTLLSPFDNLICDRTRTKMLFEFDYTMEIYVPKDKRKYGYYVLPLLHGDQFIGRVDSIMDRANNRLIVKSVYREPSAPKSCALGNAATTAIENLAKFLGASDIVFKKKLPKGWI